MAVGYDGGMRWKVRDRQLDLESRTLLMGVVNVTPNSFSGDGIGDPQQAIGHAEKLLGEGADLLDIGGESSRPGAEPVPADEELRRVLPVVKHLVKHTEAIISVDTAKPEVAESVLKEGAHIINDITGLADEQMAKIVAQHKAGVVIMHMQGKPQTMQDNPHYSDVIGEVSDFLRERTKRAAAAGIHQDQIMVDPGIGFGKTLEHNLALLHNLKTIAKTTVQPLLVGTSRKRFIGSLVGKDQPGDRIWGTAGSVALAVANGAQVVRVHDVAEMRDVVQVADAIVRYTENK